LQEGVQHICPDHVVESPQCGRGGADARQRRIRVFGYWEGDGGVGFGVLDGEVPVRGQFVAAGEAEPVLVDAGEFAEVGLFLGEAELEQVVEIAEAPRDEAEAGDAEERVQHLGVNFDPDPSRGVDVVAVFVSWWGGDGVAHVLAAAAD